MRPIAFAVLLAALAPMAVLAQTKPTTEPATTQPTVDEQYKGIRFPWITINYAAKAYKVQVSINGKDYVTYENATGSATKMTPLIAGKNQIVVDFTPGAAPVGDDQEKYGEISFVCFPRQKPKDEDPAAQLTDMAVSPGYARLTHVVDYVNDQPRNFTTHQQTWADAEHKSLLWEYTADGDVLDEEYAHEKETSWRPDGKLAEESISEKGKLMTFKAYKPDGSVAAEVKGGNGTKSSLDEQGAVVYTCTYKDGLQDGEQTEFFPNGKPFELSHYVMGEQQGEFKRYDEEGKLRVTGQMKDDEPNGVWHSLGDDGKPVEDCEFKNGLLLKGNNLYTPEEKE